MGQRYFPEKRFTETITASTPHPENTEYKISVGDEYWSDDGRNRVLKIQMTYSGRVAGRKSPSFTSKKDCREIIRILERFMAESDLPEG